MDKLLSITNKVKLLKNPFSDEIILLKNYDYYIRKVRVKNLHFWVKDMLTINL